MFVLACASRRYRHRGRQEGSKYGRGDLEQSSTKYAIDPARTAVKKAKAVFAAALHARLLRQRVPDSVAKSMPSAPSARTRMPVHICEHARTGITLAQKYAFFFCKTHPGDLAALVLPTLLKGCTQPLMPTSSLRHGRTRVRLYGVISVYQSWLARLCMARKANAGSINQGLKLTVHLQRDLCANVQTHSNFQTLAPNAR